MEFLEEIKGTYILLLIILNLYLFQALIFKIIIKEYIKINNSINKS